MDRPVDFSLLLHVFGPTAIIDILVCGRSINNGTAGVGEVWIPWELAPAGKQVFG